MRTPSTIALVALTLLVAASALADVGSHAKRVPRGSLRLPTQLDSVEGPGQLDPAVFLRMISSRRAALRACYERVLRDDPTLAGSVRVRAVIAEIGAMQEVTIVESTVARVDVTDCVQRVIRGFRFYPGPTGGSVSYTITLTYEPEH